MRLLFGQLEPDKAEHLQEGLRTADNVYPAANGYRPTKAFAAMSSALASEFKGGASFRASDNTIQLLAGTGTNLYRFDSTLAWSSILGSLSAGRWYFTQFNDRAIATHGGAPIDVNLTAGTAAALAGTPPNADFCATTADFVILAKGNTITWSGFQDRTQWTAGVNQSGSQSLLEGGPVTGLAGGDYCLIFQRNHIRRMAPNYSDTIWQFDVISSNVGCVAAGSIAQVGRLVFFLSDRGWYVTDGNDVKPLGEERVDRTYLSDFLPTDIETSMYACVDPETQLVIWTMPNQQFNYHISLDRWTTGSQAVKAVFPGYTSGVSLDALDAIYGNLDAMGDISLDDPRFKGGNPQLYFINNDDEIGALTGDNTAATFQAGFYELTQERATRVRVMKPITDAENGLTIQLNLRKKLGASGTTRTYTSVRATGDMPVRFSSHYVRPRVAIEAGADWNYFQGITFKERAVGPKR